MKLHPAPFALAFAVLATSAARLPAGALSLDGSGDIVTFPGTGIPSGNSPFTIEAWINPTTIPSGGADGGQITFWGNQTANQANGFRLRGATGVRHYFWSNDHDENFGMDILPDTTGPSANGWHHLAITFDGTQTRWYWNGAPLGNPRTAAGVSVLAANHRIGSRLNDLEFFHGFIDELRIWSTARSLADLSGNMNRPSNGTEAGLVAYWDFEGDFGDRAGGNNNGTPVGNAAINAGVNAPIQTAGPRITSFTADPSPVYEAGTLTFAWVIDASAVSGTLTVTILGEGNTVLHVTNSAAGVQPMVIGDTAGQARTVTYTLRAGESGGSQVSREATVDAQLLPGLPVADPQPDLRTVATTPLPITLTGSDPNTHPNPQLTFSIVTPPAGGSLSGTPPAVTYTAGAGFLGHDAFTFKANDGKYDSTPATIAINVIAVPTPPADILLSSTNLNSLAVPGTLLATLRAVDVNANDTHEFALVAGFGDNAQFVIEENRLLAGPTYAGAVGTNFLIRVRATDSATMTFEKTFALQVIELALNVVINEIHYNPPTNYLREEFIELYNPAPVAVDLSLWRLSDAVSYVFTNGTVIPAEGYLVVAQDPATLLAQYGASSVGPWEGNLNSDGERVALRNANNQMVDEVDFRAEFPWPILANGQGPSMELVHDQLDNDLGSSWRSAGATGGTARPTPGARNSVYAGNAAPNIRQVNHTPKAPASTNPVTITCKVTDPDGVASVRLHYQVVAPGNHIPAFLALTPTALDANPAQVPPPNPAFEDTNNWTSVVMLDDGGGGDEAAGDSIYTVVLPPQANRTLVRYRITVTDALGTSRRAPFEDDASLNFAYFVYDGLPEYQGVSAEVLGSLPVYFLLTRAEDMRNCSAYDAYQLPQFIGSASNPARFVYNWPGTLVYDGEVYDHIQYRLRGANGRYQPGKRNYRLRFNEGRHLAVRDQNGHRFPTKWSTLVTGKGQSNRQTVTFGFNEIVNYYLFNKVGVPAPYTFYFHFRVVDGALEAPDPYTGDFWGLNWAQENYDVRFLEAHNLAKGNLYKLINSLQDAANQERYQAPDGVTDGSDFNNIENNLTGFQTTAWLLAHVNYSNWFRYHALVEGVKHYDFWPSANKNAGWYFEPLYLPENSHRGRMWTFPWDTDSSWGPTWNAGHDVVYNGIFPSTATGGDSGENPELQLDYRNAVREVRDLVFQRDQMDPILEAFAAQIRPFIPADLARWTSVSTPPGSSYQSLSSPGPALQGLDAYLADMQNFLWVGGSWPGGTVPAGGQVTRMDQVTADAAIPNPPTVTYVGTNGFPLDGLVFQSTMFADPQGGGTFGAMQWRVAEVLPTGSAVTNPAGLKLEWDAVWSTPAIAPFTATVTIPPSVVLADRFYRVRVRHQDLTGRWSHWSAPFEFRPGRVDLVSPLRQYLVIAELMYRPAVTAGQDDDDYEWLELKNTGPIPLDLSGVFFSAGINFTFPIGTTLAPDQTFLLVREPARFLERYPGVTVDGDYSGKLDNAGETVALSHPHGGEFLAVTYDDRAPWPVAADGQGFSLVLVDAATQTYHAAAQPGGTPGSDGDPTPAGGVVINEVLSNSKPPLVDALELRNLTGTNVAIGGWYLTDDPGTPRKYRIPDGAVLMPNRFAVFDETQFNDPPGLPLSFSLSSFGDEVYLFSGDAAGELTGYSHGFAFGGAATGVSFGRYLNSMNEEQFPLQITSTFDNPNIGPRVGPVVMSEIHYHPLQAEDEFLELRNLTATNVPLYDPMFPTNTWRIGGLGFVFPSNVTLAADGYLVLVPTNTEVAAFRTRFGVPGDVPVLQHNGVLQDSGENLELLGPDAPDTNGTPYYIVDRVRYNDRLPWPAAADGVGPSLQRLTPAAYGHDPTNWVAAAATPGAAFLGGTPPVILTPPASQTTAEFGSVTFQVSVAGSGPYAYAWRHEGTIIAGATNAVLMLDSVQLTDAGDYSVIVFSGGLAAASAPATLTVLRAPEILTQPLGAIVNAGESAAFNVVATGTGTVGFQWRRNGVDIPGATSFALTVPNAQFDVNDGYYTVVVTDSVGSRESEPALLTVKTRPTITQPLLVSPSPNVFEGRTFTVSLSASGSFPMGFRFRAPGNAYFAVIQTHSNHSTVTVVVENAKSNLHAGSWDVGITNIGGSTLSTRVTINVLPAAPFFALQPGDQNAVLGTDAWLASEARGTDPISYQWYHHGTNALAGATNASLTLSNLQAGGLGDYQVVAANSLGTVTSDVARVMVPAPPQIAVQPADQTVTICSNATFTVVAESGTPLSYQWYFNGTTRLAGETAATLVIPQPTPQRAGDYTVVVANLVAAATSAVARLTVLLGDSDGDGLADDWELAHGLNPCDAGDRDLDPDHDGRTNWEEAASGTDPNDHASVLQVNLSNDGNGGAVVRFLAMPDVGYTIQYRARLMDGLWVNWTNLPPQPGTHAVEVTDPEARANGGRFYRLVTPRQP